MGTIAETGAPCLAGSCSEIYLEKAFPPSWKPQHSLPIARELGKTSLMLLVHPTQSTSDMEVVANLVTDVMNESTA
jgi:dTDP-4-amino-4,6-dideoxygalactose transaminase